MNAIKKIVMFLVFILIHNKVSAQTQNNASAQLVEVNTLNVQLVKELNVEVESTTSQISPLEPNFILKKDSVLNSTTILYDPKVMDSKPQ